MYEYKEKKMKTGIRNIYMDILKIISMFMVVLLHATNFGIQNIKIEIGSINYFIVWIIRIFSMVAVNCFVLISGYFLCQKKENKENILKKIIRLWVQTEMYSIGLYLLLCFIPQNGVRFSIKTCIKQSFPILTYEYWFIVMYILLLLISPLLNIIINNIKQEEYKTLIKLALFVFSIIPSINVFGDEFGTNSGYSLIWFVVLYFIGAYLKIYGLKKRKYLKWYCSICIGLFIIKYICDMVGLKKSFVKAIPNLLIKYNSIFIIIASICLFCGMVGSTIKVGDKIEKQIIILSQASLGVYLLHENREFRMLLWNRIVNLKRFSEMPILFGGYIIVSAVVIFFIGIVCEMSRKSLMDLLKKRVKKNLSTVKFSFAKKVYGRK